MHEVRLPTIGHCLKLREGVDALLLLAPVEAVAPIRQQIAQKGFGRSVRPGFGGRGRRNPVSATRRRRSAGTSSGTWTVNGINGTS